MAADDVSAATPLEAVQKKTFAPLKKRKPMQRHRR
jgi:hypothetical protein